MVDNGGHVSQTSCHKTVTMATTYLVPKNTGYTIYRNVTPSRLWQWVSWKSRFKSGSELKLPPPPPSMGSCWDPMVSLSGTDKVSTDWLFWIIEFPPGGAKLTPSEKAFKQIFGSIGLDCWGTAPSLLCREQHNLCHHSPVQPLSLSIGPFVKSCHPSLLSIWGSHLLVGSPLYL